MINYKKYKIEVHIFILLSLTAISWQLMQLLVKFYAAEYLPETIFIQGVIVFGSFIISLGFGTHIRFLIYKKRVKDIRVSFKMINIIIAFFFILASVYIVFSFIFGLQDSSFPLLAIISLITLFSFNINYAVSTRRVKTLYLFTLLYVLYTIVLLLFCIFIKINFDIEYSLKFIYSLASLSGIIFIYNGIKHMNVKVDKVKILENIKESFSFFYIAIPIRLLLFILAILISKVGKLELALTEVFIYSQLLSSLVKFVMSRIFLLLEKSTMQKSQIYIFRILAITLVLEVSIYLILCFIIGTSTLTGFLLITLFLNALVYSYVKQFLAINHKYIESTILLLFLTPFIAMVIYASIPFLLDSLDYILIVLNIGILLLTIRKNDNKYIIQNGVNK